MRKEHLRLPGLALGAGLCLAALCLAVPVRAAQAPVATQRFGETAEVVVVEVPVQVVKDGEPVRGLTADNFEVYDGRKKQKVTGFEALDLYSAAAQTAPGAAPAAAVPAAARRHFLMIFDLSFSEPKSIIKARDAAKTLIKGLHPTDMVAVSTYSAQKGPQLVLGFTSDRRQIDSALSTLGVPQLVDRAPDPLHLVLTSLQDEMSGQAAAPLERKGAENKDATTQAMLDTFKQFSIASEKAEASAQKTAIASYSRSMADLAKMMGSVDGRKMVVYLSEGFDSSLLTGTADLKEQNDMAASAQSGEIWNVDSEKRYGDTKTMGNVEKMLEEFRRADCTIQAVDIGGLRASNDQGFQRKGGADSLLMMAKGTGGELFENYNDLSVAMNQMLRRTGVTYVLTYQPEDVKHDGEFHKLRVELKNAPRGARIVHRPGYYAPLPFAKQSPLEKLLQTANDVMSGEESGSISTSVLAAPFQVPGTEKAYVPVLIEIDGKTLTANTTGTMLPAEIYVYALDQSGAVHDYLSQTMGLDLSKAGTALSQNGLKFFGHLDLMPGDYSIRVLVRNGVSGASSLRVVPVHVAAQGQPALLPAFFPEAPNKWILAKEAQRGAGKAPSYPFVARQESYIPAGHPVLSEGQETRMALVGYNLGTGELQTESKILRKDGKEVGTADVKVVEREPGTPDRLLATFKPSKLEPGEYLLRVTVTNGAGLSQSSTAPFVVGAPTRG
ncbi:MAG TPA: VWA domain-containing protein [Thermoanaerobaculia bacterium]|nr:VWA domain-containing protein [Thermoanaerobaculia bacterium]